VARLSLNWHAVRRAVRDPPGVSLLPGSSRRPAPKRETSKEALRRLRPEPLEAGRPRCRATAKTTLRSAEQGDRFLGETSSPSAPRGERRVGWRSQQPGARTGHHLWIGSSGSMERCGQRERGLPHPRPRPRAKYCGRPPTRTAPFRFDLAGAPASRQIGRSARWISEGRTVDGVLRASSFDGGRTALRELPAVMCAATPRLTAFAASL
jgi:hypothetical protein